MEANFWHGACPFARAAVLERRVRRGGAGRGSAAARGAVGAGRVERVRARRRSDLRAGRAGAPRGGPRREHRAPGAGAEILAEATERLAVHIGPVARLLVKRDAEQASGARDLYERLARHIDDPKARQRFVAATEELSEP